MSIPSDHHFNPAFSIQPWAGADDRVCQMRLIRGRVVRNRKHPTATGFQKDLYKTEGLPGDQEMHLEQNFLAPLDGSAAVALQKMLSGDKDAVATSEQRSGWTRYLLSLMYRNKETVTDLKTHMLNVWSVAQANIKENFATWRRIDDPGTFEEFQAMLDPAGPYIGATNLLIQIIDNARVGPTVFNMDWSVMRLRSSIPLLLSDHPLDRPRGLADPKAYIALPISPTAVFLAANDPRMKDFMQTRSHAEIAQNLNLAVVSQASEYVWAKDDSQLEFVRENFGKAPVHSAIIQAQKAASLRAAAGEPDEP
jgi:Protein of unknown function (DUF4238)